MSSKASRWLDLYRSPTKKRCRNNWLCIIQTVYMGAKMWIEYVRDGLKKGQQVFRRSVVEALMDEIGQQKPTSGDSAEVAALKRELAIAKKQYRDLNIRFYQIKSRMDDKGQLNAPDSDGEISMPLG